MRMMMPTITPITIPAIAPGDKPLLDVDASGVGVYVLPLVPIAGAKVSVVVVAAAVVVAAEPEEVGLVGAEKVSVDVSPVSGTH
jgi:hypothetical protein